MDVIIHLFSHPVRRTIKIKEEACELLAALKIGKGGSFTNVILRHVCHAEIKDAGKFIKTPGGHPKRRF
jgi:hypothetical protein